tara:strand:+ start:1122 stop:1745 length:624 start_codon:yes stop_codon:yes gene_type:complete
MNTNGIIHLLFPTPIMTFDVERHQEYKAKYVPLLLEEKRKNPNQKAKWAIADNTWTMFHAEKIMNVIDAQVKSKINEYISFIADEEKRLDLDFFSWVNIHTSSMHQEQHAHPGAIVCGVYYLQFDENKDFPANFVNPAEYEIGAWTIGCEKKIQLNNHFLNSHTYPNQLNVKEGTLVLFPPHAAHSVPQSYEHDQARITYTFNVYVK